MMTAVYMHHLNVTKGIHVTRFVEYHRHYSDSAGHNSVSYFIRIARIAFTLLLTQHVIMQFFIFVNVMWLYYRYFRLRNAWIDNDYHKCHQYVLTKEEFQQLPHRKVLAKNDGEECPICLCQYIRNQRLRVLPCSHYFHTRCIQRWLTGMSTMCPLCRYDLIDLDSDDE